MATTSVPSCQQNIVIIIISNKIGYNGFESTNIDIQLKSTKFDWPWKWNLQIDHVVTVNQSCKCLQL